MITKIVCEKCGKEFAGDYIEATISCMEHEFQEHLNATEIFKERLIIVLNELDNVYNTKTQYDVREIIIQEGYCNNIEDILYRFTITNDIFSESIIIKVFDIEIPTTQKIRNSIEKYFKASVKKYYEGMVTFEAYDGGNGADDYVLDGQYVNDIFRELLNKKIKITIVE